MYRRTAVRLCHCKFYFAFHLLIINQLIDNPSAGGSNGRVYLSSTFGRLPMSVEFRILDAPAHDWVDRICYVNDTANNFQVQRNTSTGDLDIHGQHETVTFPVTLKIDVASDGTFTYDVDGTTGSGTHLLADNTDLTFNFYGVRNTSITDPMPQLDYYWFLNG